MPRQRIGLDDVVTVALDVVDRGGLDELGVGRVAAELGVQGSALYNHVDGLDGLRQAVATQATENLAATLRDAAVARAGDDALRAIAHAYRTFARDHPGQYGMTLLPVGTTVDAAEEPHAWIGEVVLRILEGFDLTGGTAVHHSRIVRSAIHGFVSLEANDAFTRPDDRDASFESLLDFLLAGLRAARDPDPATAG